MNESGGRFSSHSQWARIHEPPIFGRSFQRLYGRRSTSDDRPHVIEISGTNETLLLDGPILICLLATKLLGTSNLAPLMAIIAMRKERPNAQCECGGTEEPAEQVS